MIEFSQKDNFLTLTYSTDNPWVMNEFKKGYETVVTVKKTFHFLKKDLYLPNNVTEDENVVEFILGRKDGDYFKIGGRFFDIKQGVFIHKSIVFSDNFFIAIKSISVFKKISEVVSEDIYIGGEDLKALPESEFRKLLKDFPNSYEIRKYAHARMGSVLSNYFDSASKVQDKYDNYMNKRQSVQGEDLSEKFKTGEILKYEAILKKLDGMLKIETSYNEKQWQNEILDIILLLYPKYISVFQKTPVIDIYNKKNRELDILLVDVNGNIDIIEIKRPFDNQIITKGKYRDNHIPLRELSGTVMQIEKYIFYLNKWGKKGENMLTKKYKAKLPSKFKLKITNPSGMIIMGRDNNLSVAQKEDFEVIKRKYKNIIDIITYDDLLRRLRMVIESFKKH